MLLFVLRERLATDGVNSGNFSFFCLSTMGNYVRATMGKDETGINFMTVWCFVFKFHPKLVRENIFGVAKFENDEFSCFLFPVPNSESIRSTIVKPGNSKIEKFSLSFEIRTKMNSDKVSFSENIRKCFIFQLHRKNSDK